MSSESKMKELEAGAGDEADEPAAAVNGVREGVGTQQLLRTTTSTAGRAHGASLVRLPDQQERRGDVVAGTRSLRSKSTLLHASLIGMVSKMAPLDII
jgi:hypothetical protein